MMPLRPSALAICFALLATSCNQSVDARFESALDRAIDSAPTPEQATSLRSIRENAENLTADQKREFIAAVEKSERANKLLEDIEAEGRAKGY